MEKNEEELDPDEILNEMNKPIEEEKKQEPKTTKNTEGIFNIPVHIEIGNYHFDCPFGILLICGIFLFMICMVI